MTPQSSNENSHDLSDRELLIRIHEQVKVLPDHEKRLRYLERIANWLIGAWGLITTLLGLHTYGGHK